MGLPCCNQTQKIDEGFYPKNEKTCFALKYLYQPKLNVLLAAASCRWAMWCDNIQITKKKKTLKQAGIWCHAWTSRRFVTGLTHLCSCAFNSSPGRVCTPCSTAVVLTSGAVVWLQPTALCGMSDPLKLCLQLRLSKNKNHTKRIQKI